MQEQKVKKALAFAIVAASAAAWALCASGSIHVEDISLYKSSSTWTRATYMIAHTSIMHLAVNAWCVITIASRKDTRLTEIAAALVIALIIPVSAIPASGMAGESAAVFATLGMITAKSPEWKKYAAISTAFVAAGFAMPGIAAAAHAYAYIMGVLYGLSTMEYEWKK